MHLFTAPDVIVECLIHIHSEAETVGWGSSPALHVMHEATTDTDRQHGMRALSFTPVPMSDDAWLHHPDGVAGVLGEVATSLTFTQSPMAKYLTDIAPPGGLIVGWAVVYEDVHTCPDHIAEMRRADAIDIDTRLYELSHVRGDGAGRAVVDTTEDRHSYHTPIQAQLYSLMRVSRNAHLGGWPL